MKINFAIFVSVFVEKHKRMVKGGNVYFVEWK